MSKAVMKQALDAMLKGYAGLNFEAYSAAVGSLQAAIANPEPYDQEALELCDVCGWKAIIPGEPCLMCEGHQRMLSSSKFSLGDVVKKRSGSEWTGKVVGYYSTALTPVGCCVESSSHAGSVQIYPESALEATINQGELNLAKLQTWLPYDDEDDLK